MPGRPSTCPVGDSCKHAIAVIAEYLKAIGDDRKVPIAAEDDPRLILIEEGGDWDEEDWDEDDEDNVPAPRRPARAKGFSADWNAKIQEHIRSKSQSELADLAWSLTLPFPEVYQEFRDRLALQSGDGDRLVAEARKEIRRTIAGPTRSNSRGEGSGPMDFELIRHRLERLLDLGHADQVISLGRTIVDDGMNTVAETDDEDRSNSRAFSECLAVIFRAVAESSLPGPDRLLLAIDAQMADQYDLVNETADVVFEASSTIEDWSSVADTLAGRLGAAPGRKSGGPDDFSRRYRRYRLTNRLASPLEAAGRGPELDALYESESRENGSYERYVNHLIASSRLDEAERWAIEGIAATHKTYPGVSSYLAAKLAEIA